MLEARAEELPPLRTGLEAGATALADLAALVTLVDGAAVDPAARELLVAGERFSP